MINEFISFAYTLKDRQLSKMLRRTLNVVFVVGITSYLFRVFYFDYEVIDPFAYQTIYDFLVNGDFIVPTGIFVIIWFLTEFVGFLLFSLPNYVFSRRIRRAVIDFSFLKVFPDAGYENTGNAVLTRGDAIRINRLEHVFMEIKKSISAMDFRRIRENIDRVKHSLEDEFVLLVRATFALLCYLSNVLYFGWVLFSFLIVTIAVIAVVLYLKFQLAEVLPVVLHKTADEIAEYFNTIHKTETSARIAKPLEE